jgi:hypothetical protein
VVEQFMVKGERGGQVSRTASITVVEPVLVPMSQAEWAAAVSAFTEVVAGWWRSTPMKSGPACTSRSRWNDRRPDLADERLRRERSTTVRLAWRRIDEGRQFSGVP